EAAARVVPTDQGLDPDEGPVRQLPDRQVVEHELALAQPPVELGRELELLDGAGVHRGFEDLVSIPASPLRVVRRRVRVAEEVVGRGRRDAAAERDPDASADGYLVALGEERLVQD